MTKDEVRTFIHGVVTDDNGELADDIFKHLAMHVTERCEMMGAAEKILEWNEYGVPALSATTMRRLANLCAESAELWKNIYVANVAALDDAA